jgi:hypothetical protein
VTGMDPTRPHARPGPPARHTRQNTRDVAIGAHSARYLRGFVGVPERRIANVGPA